MRQSKARSWVHDVTLQDSGTRASNTLFLSETELWLILTRNAKRESLQMERYQKLSGNGRKCIYVSRHTAQGIRVTVFTDGLQTGGSDKMDNTRRKESFFYRDTDISTIFHPWDSHVFTH